jgi:hypothetical protein
LADGGGVGEGGCACGVGGCESVGGASLKEKGVEVSIDHEVD